MAFAVNIQGAINQKEVVAGYANILSFLPVSLNCVIVHALNVFFLVFITSVTFLPHPSYSVVVFLQSVYCSEFTNAFSLERLCCSLSLGFRTVQGPTVINPNGNRKSKVRILYQ